MGPVSGSLRPAGLVLCSLPTLPLSDYCSFVASPGSLTAASLPSSVLPLQYFVGYLGSFASTHKLYEEFVDVHKELAGILIRINLLMELGRTDTVTILSLPILSSLHMEYLFIYSSADDFIHQNFSVFLIEILYTLNLYVSILFWEGANKWNCVFNFKFHLFIADIGKMVNFCILTLCPTNLL